MKHGDKVTCEIQGTKITDARISINKNGRRYICQNEIDGADAYDKLGYKYSWCFNKDNPEKDGVTNLKLAHKTLDDIGVGDVLVKDGEEYPVLMRSGQVVMLGCKEDYGYSALFPKTIDELKYYGYTLKQDEPVKAPKEMTVAEVAKALGYEVKIVK